MSSKRANRYFHVVRMLFLALAVPVASAQTAPSIVVNQVAQLGAFAGVFQGSYSPVGGTFVVGANGNVIVGTETSLLQITPSGTQSTLAALNFAGPVAIDSNGNVYVAAVASNPAIYKIPFIASTQSYAGFTTNPAAVCLGGTIDTAACVFALNFQSISTNGSYGFASLAFDASGNFFAATDTLPSPANTIYECNAACQADTTGTQKPVAIYSDTNSIGALAIDPWGNLFFTDNNAAVSFFSYLNELQFQAGAYAATPVVQETYHNNDELPYGGFTGVATDANGTVYFTTVLDGAYAIPNTQSGGLNLSNTYAVSAVGGYEVALDFKGNVYQVVLGSNGYTVQRTLENSLAVPAAAVGTSKTASFTVIDNAVVCPRGSFTFPATLTFSATENGAATSEFSATAGSSCLPTLGPYAVFSPALKLTGSVITPNTINFSPAIVGARSAVLTVSDGTNSRSITATGVGLGPLISLDPGVPTTYLALPAAGFSGGNGIAVDAAGDILIADGTKLFEIPHGSTTPNEIASGFSSLAGLVFDAHGNLYLADSGLQEIFEIPNVSGSLAPSSQVTVVSRSTTFAGVPVNSPTQLAMGPDGVLYIGDVGTKQVDSYNPSNGLTSVRLSGLQGIGGVAVDAANNLYVATAASGGSLLLYSPGGGLTTVPLGSVVPAGLAVDASGGVLISDQATGNIVLVPNLSGTLSAVGMVTVEQLTGAAGPIALDASGNLVAVDAGNGSVYWIQRTAAAINFGNVSDGTSGSATIYVESAGNTQLTFGSPVFAPPSNPMFTLATALANGCTAGSSEPSGTVCQLTAQFSPPNATVAGPQTGTSTLSSSALNSPTPAVVLSGTAVFANSVTPQTITFNNPGTQTAGTWLTLSATASSGLTVSFASSTTSVCTVAGTIATFLVAGTCTIQAMQAGNSTYSAAPMVSQSFTVNAASGAAELNGGNTFNGNQTVNGVVTATSFVGVGSGLTGVPGSVITGEVASAADAGTSAMATYAAALAATPSQCGTNQFSTGIAASGNANCLQPASANLSDYSTLVFNTQANTFTGPQTFAAGGVLPPTGTATASQAFNSSRLDTIASAFNSTSGAPQNEVFRWLAEPVAGTNNTANPSATLNLLFGSNGTPNETGLSVTANGTINFASGQTFPGTGPGTISGVTAGTGLSGGGTSGNVTLTNSGILSLTAGTGLLSTGSQMPTLSLNTAFTDARYLLLSGGTLSGGLAAPSFAGNGSALTNLNPANLSSGTAGISITGNAATATTAGTATTAAIATTAGTATTANNALELGGVAPSGYALAGANSFTGTQTMPSASVSGEVTAGSIAIGGGTPIKEYVSVTLSVTLPRMGAGGCTTFTTAALTGFTPGTSDTIALGVPGSLINISTAFVLWQAWETSTATSSTITIRACNIGNTEGATGTIRVDVFKH